MDFHKPNTFLITLLMVEIVLLQGAHPATIIAGPQNCTAFVDDKVTLACRFDEPVACAWQRNLDTVSIRSRYRYHDTSAASKPVDDCSIVISSVQEADVGQWLCQSLATDTAHAISSDPAYLSIQNNFDKIGEDPPTTSDNSTVIGIVIAMISIVLVVIIVAGTFYFRSKWRSAKVEEDKREDAVHPLTSQMAPPHDNTDAIITISAKLEEDELDKSGDEAIQPLTSQMGPPHDNTDTI